MNCWNSVNTAYYKFTGAAVGNLFNVNQGQISFYLKSRYSFAQRQTSAAAMRFAFDVRDASNHLFDFFTQITPVGGSPYLLFTYTLGGSTQDYWVPQGTEDTV